MSRYYSNDFFFIIQFGILDFDGVHNMYLCNKCVCVFFIIIIIMSVTIFGLDSKNTLKHSHHTLKDVRTFCPVVYTLFKTFF